MKTKVKNLSEYEMREMLNALCDMKATMEKYSHVFEDNNKIYSSIEAEIELISMELDRREAIEYGINL